MVAILKPDVKSAVERMRKRDVRMAVRRKENEGVQGGVGGDVGGGGKRVAEGCQSRHNARRVGYQVKAKVA